MTDESRVLSEIRKRLELGLKNYGALNIATDRRDFRQEALEEALDLAVYLSIALLRPKRRIVGWRVVYDDGMRTALMALDRAKMHIKVATSLGARKIVRVYRVRRPRKR